MNTVKKTIDGETIHNWVNRYADSPYYRDLPVAVREHIRCLHNAHHRDGMNAGDAATMAAACHPEHLERAERW